MILTFSVIALCFSAISAVLFVRNLKFYVAPPAASLTDEKISIVLPARNEEKTIRESVTSALRSQLVELEVLVIDDGSEDRTADIVRELAEADARVRLIEADELPPGWNGKQHACWIGANQARYELLCFIDSDLRLSADGLARMIAERKLRDADLVSGVPLQEANTWSERLMMPLISFLLLGYLPMEGVRNTSKVEFGAGIGQLFLCKRGAYFQSGGHSAIRETLHDGLRLPKLFREHGLKTDLFDATQVARCRMYETFPQVWAGLSKNAVEGMAAPRLIGVFTVLLFAGHVLPFVTLAWSLARGEWPSLLVSAVAVTLSYLPRAIAAHRFEQSFVWALCHPISIAVLLAIQWTALTRHMQGRPSMWRGREYRLP